MSQHKIKVMIADDHPLVSEGIQSCLDTYDHIDVVGIAKSGEDALVLANETAPDIVLMDINMPGINGLEATEIFREKFPSIKLLILSMHNTKEYISTAVMHGAKGYVLKDVPTREIVTAIESVNSGGKYFSSGISDLLIEAKRQERQMDSLTSREQSVLLSLANGKSNKEVARELDISVRTVETHRKNIKRKLGISSTAGLTRYAIENGIIP